MTCVFARRWCVKVVFFGRFACIRAEVFLYNVLLEINRPCTLIVRPVGALAVVWVLDARCICNRSSDGGSWLTKQERKTSSISPRTLAWMCTSAWPQPSRPERLDSETHEQAYVRDATLPLFSPCTTRPLRALYKARSSHSIAGRCRARSQTGM